MATLAVVLEGLSLGLSVAGITLSIIRRLRSYVIGNKVLQDPIWDEKSEALVSPDVRSVGCSQWIQDKDLQDERPSIRAAYECFDGIYNFLKAGQAERAHFSGRLHIIYPDGSIATEGGLSLSLSGNDSDEDAFNYVSDFVDGILGLQELKEKFFSADNTVVALDANVMDNTRYLRSERDTTEIISMAAITLEVLKEVANVLSDGQFVKIIPGKLLKLSFDNPSVAYITARWPGTDGNTVKTIKRLHAAMDDAEADFNELCASVAKCSVDDGVRNIILLGRTGSGKSHTGNWLLGEREPECTDRFEESNAGSLTSFVDYLPKQKSKVRVWDTPGLDDAYNRDAQHMDDIDRATLEMGTVSAVILCFPSLERIDGPMRNNLRRYGRIVGGALRSRLVVVVNRQPSAVTEEQKKSLQAAFYQEGRIEINFDRIYDLGENTPDIRTKKYLALRGVMAMCSKTAVKVGYMERLSAGLLELQNLRNPEEREEAQEMLLRLSYKALRRKLTSSRRGFPLSERFNDGTRFILSNGHTFKDKNGAIYMEEHILNMPDSVRAHFKSKISIFMQGMKIRHGVEQKVATKVREMRLVFTGRPSSVTEKEKTGVITYKKQIHYNLVSVDDALTEDVRNLLAHALGDDGASNTDVTAFAAMRPKRGPKRRSAPK